MEKAVTTVTDTCEVESSGIQTMKMEKKIAITVLAILAIALLGGVLFVFKSFRGGTTLTHETPQGQRAITLPAIPGTEKVSEEKGECFQETSYIFTATKMDISSEIKDRLKSTFAERGWNILKETAEVVSFTTQEKGELERINLQIGFEEGRGTLLTLEYQWPPCSEEK